MYRGRCEATISPIGHGKSTVMHMTRTCPSYGCLTTSVKTAACTVQKVLTHTSNACPQPLTRAWASMPEAGGMPHSSSGKNHTATVIRYNFNADCIQKPFVIRTFSTSTAWLLPQLLVYRSPKHDVQGSPLPTANERPDKNPHLGPTPVAVLVIQFAFRLTVAEQWHTEARVQRGPCC